MLINEDGNPMTSTTLNTPTTQPEDFIDRRGEKLEPTPRPERRQFSSSHDELSYEARELALAIDSYKLEHRRRYITFEEMLGVVKQLGYSR